MHMTWHCLLGLNMSCRILSVTRKQPFSISGSPLVEAKLMYRILGWIKRLCMIVCMVAYSNRCSSLTCVFFQVWILKRKLEHKRMNWHRVMAKTKDASFIVQSSDQLLFKTARAGLIRLIQCLLECRVEVGEKIESGIKESVRIWV